LTDTGGILFSIIIPTYNAASTLQNCLQSVLDQTFTAFEVLLIDGCSTDDTMSIIKRYQDRYAGVRCISEPDKGIYDAMNKGIGLAKAKWLYFLGSDDTLSGNQVLAGVAEYAQMHRQGVLYGSVIMRGQNQWNLDNVVFDGEYTTEKFIDRNICHQAMFYHRDVFERNGEFNLRYITSADFDFNMRCYANTPFFFIDLIIANFFVGGHSTHITDHAFYDDRGALLYRYFGSRIFSKEFVNARLYLQQAAFSKRSPLNLFQRLYCALAYAKLKLQAMNT